MWVGADYRPVSGKWKWRNAFVGFDGTLEFINSPNFQKTETYLYWPRPENAGNF